MAGLSDASHLFVLLCSHQALLTRMAYSRLESEHAVTASNLFPYCQPCHGLVLFRHHDALAFSLKQLGDALHLAQAWLQRASSHHPEARHPALLWNTGASAGASQAHGHLQVMLSQAR